VAITLSQLAKDALVVYPASNSYFMSTDKPPVVLKCFFENFLSEFCFNTLKHLQSCVVAFIEQIQNTEKSKASTVDVVSCFVIVKARIQ